MMRRSGSLGMKPPGKVLAQEKAPKPARDESSDEPALLAMQLLGRWGRVAQGHVMLGSGCVCGADFGAVAVGEFEQDILDFLHGRHPVLAEFAPGGNIAGVLRKIAQPGTGLGAAAAAAVLADLNRSIDSFEQAHRTG